MFVVLVFFNYGKSTQEKIASTSFLIFPTHHLSYTNPLFYINDLESTHKFQHTKQTLTQRHKYYTAYLSLPQRLEHKYKYYKL